jgi:hypothetical protein
VKAVIDGNWIKSKRRVSFAQSIEMLSLGYNEDEGEEEEKKRSRTRRNR